MNMAKMNFNNVTVFVKYYIFRVALSLEKVFDKMKNKFLGLQYLKLIYITPN